MPKIKADVKFTLDCHNLGGDLLVECKFHYNLTTTLEGAVILVDCGGTDGCRLSHWS